MYVGVRTRSAALLLPATLNPNYGIEMQGAGLLVGILKAHRVLTWGGGYFYHMWCFSLVGRLLAALADAAASVVGRVW